MQKKSLTRVLSLVLCAVMVFGTLTGVSFAAQDFPDTDRDQWYGEAVYHCVDKGYVSGFEDGTFRPGDPITYAQLASMLPGGADAVTGGSDVNAPVTRCEMAQIASSVLAAQGLAANVSETAAVSEYIADWSSIPAEYRDAVAHCYELDVIKGYPDGTFSGGDTLTRAQACVVLMRLDKALADAKPAAAGAKPQPSDDIGADDDALADAPTALLPVGDATQAPANAATATTKTGKTKVAYGSAKYPSLSNVDYDTFRRLDYKEKSDRYTYFYDFRDSWYVASSRDGGKYANELFADKQGLWGVYARTDGDVLTYEPYSYLDNVKVSNMEFRTFDDAEAIVLDATPNVEHTRKTKNLANGPYALCAWFDYTHEDGAVESVGAWQTLYVSDGHGWFADYAYGKDDTTFKTWLAKQRETLAADDTFQAWVAKQGGDDFTKATDVTVIHYPFKSNTSRYPDDSGKWRQLAHEICPDDEANEYVKARALFAWMQSNIAYDKDATSGDMDYRWAVAAKAGSAKGYTMWDSRLGKCEDFSNVYAIMCRELGIPCHVVSNETHAWNAVYLNGRWELVDINGGIRSAYVGEDNTTYVANAKAYWAEQEAKGGYTPAWGSFCMSTLSKFKVASYEKDKYSGVEDKIAKSLEKLDNFLYDDAYYRRYSGTIYGH